MTFDLQTLHHSSFTVGCRREADRSPKAAGTNPYPRPMRSAEREKNETPQKGLLTGICFSRWRLYSRNEMQRIISYVLYVLYVVPTWPGNIFPTGNTYIPRHAFGDLWPQTDHGGGWWCLSYRLATAEEKRISNALCKCVSEKVSSL